MGNSTGSQKGCSTKGMLFHPPSCLQLHPAVILESQQPAASLQLLWCAIQGTEFAWILLGSVLTEQRLIALLSSQPALCPLDMFRE